MDRCNRSLNRRRFLQGLGVAVAMPFVPWPAFAAEDTSMHAKPIKKRIPSTGEELPVIGLGTSRTFDVGPGAERTALAAVLQAFFDRGGTLIDSSPMYGEAEEVVGELLRQTRHPAAFAATKVWIDGAQAGIRQMERSRELWGIPRFDLMQIHNLRDWQAHLKTLKDWKASGKIRYIGITTSHGRKHEELEQVLERERFDFVQLSYNLEEREAERRLLPLAADRGVAVLVNRPFQLGGLFGRVRGKPLPPWTKDLQITSWAQYFLKFAVSHPSVTCAIPATTKVKHMEDNMGAGYGALPDAATREQMARFLQTV